jgi:uncharacterized protein (UPF0276 family)
VPPLAARAGPAGVGLGLRWEFLEEILRSRPATIDFLEVSPENYMKRGGYYPDALREVASLYPVLTHGLTMSLGGTDPLDVGYLGALRDLVRDVKAPWHSDHLCFGSARGIVLHDILPIAFTEAAVVRVADRISRASDALGIPMAIENISFYLHPGRKEMGEAEFLARVCERADCGLMLDVNNAYVNATNFGFDVDEWMRVVPMDRVVQVHVAGHEWFDEGPEAGGALIVDTHGADVCDPVLGLLERVLPRIGPVPVVLERDQAIPALDGLLAEVAKIRAVCNRAMASRAIPAESG